MCAAGSEGSAIRASASAARHDSESRALRRRCADTGAARPGARAPPRHGRANPEPAHALPDQSPPTTSGLLPASRPALAITRKAASGVLVPPMRGQGTRAASILRPRRSRAFCLTAQSRPRRRLRALVWQGLPEREPRRGLRAAPRPALPRRAAQAPLEIHPLPIPDGQQAATCAPTETRPASDSASPNKVNRRSKNTPMAASQPPWNAHGGLQERPFSSQLGPCPQIQARKGLPGSREGCPPRKECPIWENALIWTR